MNVLARTIAAPDTAADASSPEDVVRLLREVRRAMHLAYVRHGERESSGALLPYIPLFGIVADHPGITISELGRMAGMPKSQVSVLMARVVRDGLASREADAADLRLVRLRMTPAGRVQLARWRAARHRVLLRALRTLPLDQLAQVTASLELLLAALQPETTQARDPRPC